MVLIDMTIKAPKISAGMIHNFNVKVASSQ